METPAPLRQQIAERLDQLTTAQQLQHALQLLEELIRPATPARPWWESLPHTITPEDAETMRQASLECRPLEPDTTPSW